MGELALAGGSPPEAALHWFDVVLLTAVLWSALRGLHKGLVREALELGGWVAALWVAAAYHRTLALAMSSRLSPETLPEFGWLPAAVFVLLVVAVQAVTALVLGLWGRLFSQPVSWVDSLAGAGLGGAKGLVVIALLLVVLASLSWPPAQQLLEQSVLASRILPEIPWLYLELREVFPNLPAPPAPLKRAPAGPAGLRVWLCPPGSSSASTHLAVA